MTLSVSHRAFLACVKLLEKTLKAVSLDLYHKAAAAFVESLDVTYEIKTDTGAIKVFCDSETARIRAKNTLGWEPDTVKWIESFQSDDVLWDIGANIGIFTLYAASVKHIRVVAFDPLPLNCAGLYRNVVLNGLHDRVMFFCMAIADSERISLLHIPAVADTVGGAGNSFDQTLDNYGEDVDALFALSTMGYSIDGLLEQFDIPFPNHLKIDIDGPPDPVIRGAEKALRDSRLKSVMIELSPTRIIQNKQAFDYVMRSLKGFGFQLVKSVGSDVNIPADQENYTLNNFFVRGDNPF